MLGERYAVTTVGERMGMNLGSTMVEATWDQCGEGHAGQVDVDDELLLLPSPDVAHAVLEAGCFCWIWLQQSLQSVIG